MYNFENNRRMKMFWNRKKLVVPSVQLGYFTITTSSKSIEPGNTGYALNRLQCFSQCKIQSLVAVNKLIVKVIFSLVIRPRIS